MRNYLGRGRAEVWNGGTSFRDWETNVASSVLTAFRKVEREALYVQHGGAELY